MRLRRVMTRDIGAPGSRELNLDDLPPGVIVLEGDNGSGKTMFLEAVPASLYRSMPSRDGGLYDQAKSHDAAIETEWVDGKGRSVRVQLLVDGPRRKMESFVFVDGQPHSVRGIQSDGKVGPFEACVADLFPTADVFMASRFMAQRWVGSLTQADVKGRRNTLRNLLRLGDYQRISDVAADLARSTEAEHYDQVVKLRELHEKESRRNELRSTLEDARSGLTAVERRCADLNERVDALTTELAAAESAATRSEAHRLLQTRDALTTELDELVRKLETLRAEGEAAAKAEHAARERLDRSKRAREESIRLQEQKAAAKRELNRITTELQELRRQVDASAARQDRDEIDRIIAGHEAAVEKTTAELQEIAVKEKELDGVTDRIERSARVASLIDDVPCRAEGEFAGCKLLADAVRARSELPELREEAGSLRAVCERRRDVEAVLPEHRTNLAHGRSYRERVVASRAAADKIEGLEMDEADIRVRAEGTITVPDISADEAAFNAAAQKCAELRTAYGETARRKTRVESELRAMPAREELVSRIDGDPYDGRPAAAVRKDRDDTQRELTEAGNSRASLTTRIEMISEELERLADLEEAIATAKAAAEELDRKLQTVKRIRHAFGPRGIQAVLIHHSGPAIADDATKMLEAAYGWRRFVLSVETLKENVSNDNLRDVLDVSVYDADKDVSGTVANLSGGEEDIVSTALALALAIREGEATGHRVETILGDESDAYIKRSLKEHWIGMLRASMDAGGPHQVVIVSHDDQVKKLADKVIHVDSLSL